MLFLIMDLESRLPVSSDAVEGEIIFELAQAVIERREKD